MPRRRRPRRSAPALIRPQPGRHGPQRAAALRLGLFALLLLGSLLRPMLILGCEIHAAAFAHAAQPHAHAHSGAHLDSDSAAAADGAAQEQGHGDHQQLQLGAAAGAADVVAPFVIATPLRSAESIPRPAPSEPVAAPAGAPFRPPIA
jgi:hypothetical protein